MQRQRSSDAPTPACQAGWLALEKPEARLT
jgi:hypothetical protein